jgi:hypothetical protein
LHTDHRYRNIGVPFNREINIKDAPEKEALDHNCWPMPEFSDVVVAPPFMVIFNLGRNDEK